MPASTPGRSSAGSRVFISCVSDEFEKPTGRFPGLRGLLRHYLSRAGCSVTVQEEFPQNDADTVEKLADLINGCAAMIHLVGERPGAVANTLAVTDFLDSVPGFLDGHPELRDALGDFSGITYTQWEAYIALHYGVRLRIYASEQAVNAQSRHLERLRITRKYPGLRLIKEPADLLGQLIGDLIDIVNVHSVQRLSLPRFLHHSAEHFLGREDELALLDTAWTDGTNVLSIVAWGGVGKTALVSEWIQTRFIDRQWLAPTGEPALLAYFDWSFYDQGTRTTSDAGSGRIRTGSVGDFFEQALTFFGDDDPSAPGRGTRLANFVRKQRTLLIVDGLEPLQQPVGNPQAGRLLDPDLRDLVYSLAHSNPGLCLITSRQSLTDLDGVHGRGARKEHLEDLPEDVAVCLLRKLQITGTDQELADASAKFGGHALSLTLLGSFLSDAHGGDIKRLDRVRDLQRADGLTRDDRHRSAWKVLEAYEDWLTRAKADGNPTILAVLRLTGLFDRTASAACLRALRDIQLSGAIRRLINGKDRQLHRFFGPIAGLTDDAWNTLLKRLERAHLIKLRAESASSWSIDAHPLIREYFAKQLRERQPEAFRIAHSLLFDHLCESTEHRPDTLPGLQPLYQAVTHGCLAGRQQEAFDKVYMDRILRGTGSGGNYSVFKLGAIGADLGAAAAFFDDPWSRITPNLSAPNRAWLLHGAGYYLRALGRLAEAVEPMRAGLGESIKAEDWANAAIAVGNLSDLEMTLGRLDEALTDARRAVELADRSKNAAQMMVRRTTFAKVLLQVGDFSEAEALFAEAERMLSQLPPHYSVQGFQYADLLLAPAERAVWQRIRYPTLSGLTSQIGTVAQEAASLLPIQEETVRDSLTACDEAVRRFARAMEWAGRYGGTLVSTGLDHLTLCRATLYRTLLTSESNSGIQNVESKTRTALAKLRDANQVQELPKALLTTALYCGTLGRNPKEALHLLDEAQLIAERGPMPLYLADVHLHRARLAGSTRYEGHGMQELGVSPVAELAKARTLIEKHGYWRRRAELADAEAALESTHL